MIKKEKVLRGSFFLGVFAFFYAFYMFFYPLTLQTPDDWRYIDYWRDAAFAMLGRGWNPSRVLPETLMPLAAHMGFILGKFWHMSFIKSIAFGLSIMLIAFIMIYFYSFDYMIRQLWKGISIYEELFIDIVFILFHFWIFRSEQIANTYMFDGGNPNTFYFYVIPYLLNCSMCFFWSVYKTKGSNRPVLVNSLLILGLYLAVFSNMFSSEIIVTYAVLNIICYCFNEYSKSKEKKIFVLDLRYELLTVMMWLYSIVAEWMGGRAHSIVDDGEGDNLLSSLIETASYLGNLIKRVNKYYAVITVLLFIYLFVFMIKDRKVREHSCIYSYVYRCIFMGICIWGYQMLLCSVVDPRYIERALISNTYFITIILIDVLAIIHIIMRVPKMMVFAPLFILIVASMLSTSMPTYSGHECWVKREEQLYDYYLDLIAEAELKDAQEITITKPDWYYGTSNEEYDKLLAEYMASTLFKYGITSKKMAISFEQ